MAEQFPCETACPIQAAKKLGEIATQLVPDAHEWLFADDRTDGLYSIDAVRTASACFQVITVPENPSYGEPLVQRDRNLVRLRDLQFAVDRGTHLNTDEISFMQRVVGEREKSKERFLSMEPQARALILERATPFLDRVAMTLMGRDKGMNELYEILGGMPMSAEEIEREQAKPPEHRLVERLYTTDQAPFIVATQALKACTGPMLYAHKPFMRGERITPICPNSTRNDRYWRAVDQTSSAPPDIIQ